MELAIVHPRACEFTSEELFYGAVLVVVKGSKMELSR